MPLRMIVTAALGVLTAFFLLWVMQALISVTGELQERGQRLAIDFVRLRRDTTPEVKDREPPKRQKPEPQPAPPPMNMAQNINPGEAVGAITPVVDTGMELEKATTLGTGSGDRGIVPLVRVDPEYPPRAKQQGIEGWVDLVFTITPAGTVEDAQITASDPPYVFDRAALRAVRRWRYNPQIKEGTPVARPGVQVRMRFEIPAGR